MVLHVHSYQLERQLGQRCVCVCVWTDIYLLILSSPSFFFTLLFIEKLSFSFNCILFSQSTSTWHLELIKYEPLLSDMWLTCFFFRLPTRKVIKNHDSWSARIRFLFSCFSSSQTPNWHVWFPGTWIFFISCFLLPSCWIILPLCLCCFGLVSSLHLYLLTLCRISSQLSLGGDWLLYVINL